jgi:outer membrane immunogenic protein
MASATLTRVLLAGAALFGATQAMAAEPFNGPYIGAEAGWQQDKLRSTLTTGGTTFEANDKVSSFAYGAQLGYDFKVSPSFVIGAEAMVGGDSGKIRVDGSTADAGRTFGLTARAGVLATPETLVYAKGGWVNGRFSFDDGTDRASQNRDGWTLGGGVERMLTQNISARVEYRYSDFKSFRENLGADSVSAGFDRHQVMAGVNFRF